jgi:hypothetical protein
MVSFGAEHKVFAVLKEKENGLKIDPCQFEISGPWLVGRGNKSKIQKGLFSDLSPT